jgi:hypothetical protein
MTYQHCAEVDHTREERKSLSELCLNGDISLLEAVSRLENYLIAQAMRQHSYHVTNAADSLKIQRTTLSMMLKAKFMFSSEINRPKRKGQYICNVCRNLDYYRECQACKKFALALECKPLMRGPES